MQKLLVVCAVDAESNAVLEGLGSSTELRLGPLTVRRHQGTDVVIDVVTAAMGPAAAAAVTAAGLTAGGHHAAISVGIAGAFPDCGLAVCDIAVADRIHYADLGAQSHEGYVSFPSLGFPAPDFASIVPAVTVTAMAQRCSLAGLTTIVGSVITLTTFTGTPTRAAELQSRTRAVAEAMEGAGVASAAALHSVPALELRSMSNMVGTRDYDSWDLPGSFTALTEAARACLREPLPL